MHVQLTHCLLRRWTDDQKRTFALKFNDYQTRMKQLNEELEKKRQAEQEALRKRYVDGLYVIF